MSGYTVKPPTGDTNEQTQFIDYFNLFYSKRGQEQISISQQLGNYGTTFFSASRQSYWNTSRSDQQISFGLNVPFGDITTSLNYSYSNNIWQNDRDHLLAFTLNVPFSHWMRTDSQSAFRNSNASYSMSNDLKGGMTNLSGVYGTLLPDNNLNYSVQVGNTHGGNTSSGTSGYSSLNYRGAYGNTNVGYSRSGDSSQIYYGMSGGIIAHADGITFGQPLGDTMVLVKAPGADNVKIENQTGIVVMSPWISRTFLEAQKYPLAYIAQANKSSHFIFRVPPLTVADKCLLTQHLMQQKHREWVSL